MTKLSPIRTNIYKRKTRSGTTTWMVRWKTPESYKWKTITGGRTKDEARAIELRIRQQLAHGIDPQVFKATKGEAITVARLIDHFYTHSRFLGGSRGWQEENKRRLEIWIRPNLGQQLFVELNKDRILKFYISMRDQGKARATIHKVHTLLCLIGDLHQDLVPGSSNPARSIRDFSRYFPKRAPKREINFLTPEEIETLTLACTGAHNPLLWNLVKFLANTGLRRNEALNLKWTDIDRTTGFIHIRQSKNGQSRTIPLEPEAWAAIEELDKRHKNIFSYKDGSRPHEDSFLDPLRTAAKRCGIKKRIDLHTLRHSFGSNKIRAGWGLKKVSLLLGHSDISITSSVYTHLLDGDLKVRDDFRFDNRGVPANILDTGGAEKLMAALLAQLTANVAKKTKRPEIISAVDGELSRAIDTLASELPLTPKQKKDLEQLRTSSNEAPTLAENTRHATPVLHPTPDQDTRIPAAELGSQENVSGFKDLSEEKMVGTSENHLTQGFNLQFSLNSANPFRAAFIRAGFGRTRR